MASLRVIDESTDGSRIAGPIIEFEVGELTVRDIISRRVRAEVRDINNGVRDVRRGLVQPTDVEEMLNGRKPGRPIDADRQVEVAIQAFERGGFLILLPDRQAESLDEPVTVDDGDEVSFLRLIPLIGG